MLTGVSGGVASVDTHTIAATTRTYERRGLAVGAGEVRRR